MRPPVDTAILSANPKFKALYSDLCNNKLHADGTSKLDAKAQKERDGVTEIESFPTDEEHFRDSFYLETGGLALVLDKTAGLRKARIEATKRELIQNELQKLAYSPSELPQDLRELVGVIAALLDGQILEEDRELLQEDVTKFKDNIKAIDAALSKQLQQNAKVLATLLDPDDAPPVDSLPTTINKLQSSIATSQTQVSEARLSLAAEACTLHATYRKAIESSIRILEQTIHGSESRGTKAKADYLALVAEGMAKKLALQQAQLLAQLYSPDMQEALGAKKAQLQSEARVTKRKVREAEEKLEAYGKVSGMESVAREYVEILRESERVEADVARLESGK